MSPCVDSFQGSSVTTYKTTWQSYIPHHNTCHITYTHSILCPDSDRCDKQECLCLHREGRSLPSGGSIPWWGGGPSYNFSSVGQLSPFLFLYLTVMNCGTGRRMTSFYKEWKECYRITDTVVELTFVFLCVTFRGSPDTKTTTTGVTDPPGSGYNPSTVSPSL